MVEKESENTVRATNQIIFFVTRGQLKDETSWSDIRR